MRLRISHVISKKYSNGILNLHVHVKKVHVIMSGEISANVCLVCAQSEGSFLRKFGVGCEFKPTSGHKVMQRLFSP